MPKCKFTKSNGLKCKLPSKVGHDYCCVHFDKIASGNALDEPTPMFQDNDNLQDDIVSLPIPPNHTKQTTEDTDTLSTIQTLQTEVDDIKNLISKLTVTIDRQQQQQQHIMIDQQKKKNVIISDQKLLLKAMRLYYQDHKHDRDIIVYLENATNNIVPKEYQPKSIPWQLIYSCTSHKFKELEEVERNMYIQRALVKIQTQSR